MALSSISLLHLKSINGVSSSSVSLHIPSKPFSVSSQLETQSSKHNTGVEIAEPKKWRKLVSTSLAAAVVALGAINMSAMAELNKFEAETRGEFGIGSAAQFGSADLKSCFYLILIFLAIVWFPGILFINLCGVCSFAGKRFMWMRISGNLLKFRKFWVSNIYVCGIGRFDMQ